MGEQGQILRDGPMVYTLRRLARSRGPRAVCNMVAWSLGAAGWPLARGAASAAVWRRSPDFCSRSCMKVLHRPDVCINRGVRRVSGPRVGKAWRDALREDGPFVACVFPPRELLNWLGQSSSFIKGFDQLDFLST